MIGTYVKIGTQRITQPNHLGVVVGETPKQISVQILHHDFAPKSSKSMTYTFPASEQKWYNERLGRVVKFWKESGKEIGGTSWIINQLTTQDKKPRILIEVKNGVVSSVLAKSLLLFGITLMLNPVH
jgi:hypothetical protein